MMHKLISHSVIVMLSISLVAHGMEKDLSEQLIDKIQFNNIAKVKELLDNEEINIDYAERSGVTPLICAVYTGSLEMVRLLIAKGANINLTDANGMTPLHYACEFSGSYPIARLLIHHGANVNMKAQSRSPLLLTCYFNNELTKLLLEESNANIDATDAFGNTPLIMASYSTYNFDSKKRLSLIALLLSHNARIDCKNNKNQTARSIALEKGYTEMVKAIDDEVQRREYNVILHQRLINYFKTPPSPEFLLLHKRT
jgi:ankyrin repeat protein